MATYHVFIIPDEEISNHALDAPGFKMAMGVSFGIVLDYVHCTVSCDEGKLIWFTSIKVIQAFKAQMEFHGVIDSVDMGFVAIRLSKVMLFFTAMLFRHRMYAMPVL